MQLLSKLASTGSRRWLVAIRPLVASRSLHQSLHTNLLKRVSPTTSHRFIQTTANNNNSEDDKKKNDKESEDSIHKSAFFLSLIGLLSYLGLQFIFSDPAVDPTKRHVSWTEFVHLMLEKGEVERVKVFPGMNYVVVYLHPDAIINGRKMTDNEFRLNMPEISQFEEKLRAAEANLGVGASGGVLVEYDRSQDTKLGSLILSCIVIIACRAFIRGRKGGMMGGVNPFSMGKAKFTTFNPESGPTVKLSDVAGCKQAKIEVMEFVDFLQSSSKYSKLGAKMPKGALLLGPPGTGKTMLAKAVATEGYVPFLSMNGSEFIEMIGGLGATRVRDLFKQAAKRAPCIIYIDEIDSIGRKRSSSGFGGTGESEQTLNQLLVEMDGINSTAGVIVLASTNRLDLLDKALLRPGRFDRHIMMDLPTQEERQEILEHHLKRINLEHPPNHYSARIAALTLGFSGADLANVVNESALFAARTLQKKVKGSDLQHAVDRVLCGPEKKTSSVGPAERRIVAYHEAGHALVGWMLEHTDTLLKVTIIPRTSAALGFAQYQPMDRKLHSQEELFEKMCMALGGRVAESVTFHSVTTGAQNDLEKVTNLAYAQVRDFGFSPVVGNISLPQTEDQMYGQKPYSDALANIIDTEARKMIFQAYKQTETIIKENKGKLGILAEALLERETLTYDDVEKLWGPPPFGGKGAVDPGRFEEEMDSWQYPEP